MLKRRPVLLSSKFRLVSTGRPELDFDYLLHPDNRKEVIENVAKRKNVGDIDRVHGAWSQLCDLMNGKSRLKNEMELKSLWDAFYEAACQLPNKTHPEAPVGGESANRIVKLCGQKPEFQAFKPRKAETIGIKYRSLRTDLSHATGDRSYAFLGPLARLESVLVKVVLRELKRRGFRLLTVPDILNTSVPTGCGLMQRSEHGILYKLKSSPGWCLSGTGEMGVASYLAGKVIPSRDLPLKLATVSRCYRPEVAAGRIAAVTKDEEAESDNFLQLLLLIQTEIFTSLNLHFRVVEMGTEELGAAAYRKFDVEAWMPGRETFGEISSASNCTDYQSRRLNIRWKNEETGTLNFVHTINGTGCAATRLIIALMESCQKQNYSLVLPEAVQTLLDEETCSDSMNKQNPSLLKMKTCDPRTRFSKKMR